MFQTSKSFLLPFFIVINALLISFGSQQYLDEYTLQIARTTKIIEDMQTVKTVKKISSKTMDQIRCLALNIYFESRGEPFIGKVAVAVVTMNRVKSDMYPKTVCDVVYQTTEKKINDETVKICQFSWVCEEKSPPVRNQQYIEAENIAKQIINENKWRDIFPHDLLFFHNTNVNPKWGYTKLTQIGNHIFYRNERSGN